MRKVINISSFSRSRINQDPVAASFYGWHSQYSRQVHERLNLTVESWSIDVGLRHNTSYERDGVRYRIFPSRFYLGPGHELSTALLRALRSELRDHDIVVHLHDFHNWQSYAIGMMFPGIPIVAHYHGATKRPLNRITSLTRAMLAPLFLVEHGLESLMIRRVRRFLLANTQDRKYYERHRLPLAFCPMAPDLQFFSSIERSAARRELGISEQARVLLNVGGFAPAKNIELTLSALSRLRGYPNIRLYLIGPTYSLTYRHAIEAAIDRLDLRTQVNVVEFLPKSQLNVYYNAADALVVTSRRDEGGPTVILEALSLGLPVLSTPIGFTSDIQARSRGELHIVDPNPDALAAAVKAELESRHDHKPVMAWTWDNVMAVVGPLYEECWRT